MTFPIGPSQLNIAFFFCGKDGNQLELHLELGLMDERENSDQKQDAE